MCCGCQQTTSIIPYLRLMMRTRTDLNTGDTVCCTTHVCVCGDPHLLGKQDFGPRVSYTAVAGLSVRMRVGCVMQGQPEAGQEGPRGELHGHSSKQQFDTCMCCQPP